MTYNASYTPAPAACSPGHAAEMVLWLCMTTPEPETIPGKMEPFAAGGIDETYLVQLADAAGILPLVAGTLASCRCDESLSGTTRADLTRRYRQNLYRTMLMQKEYATVLDALEDSGIHYIYLKGPVLSERLYGNPAFRDSVDLDILVRPDDIPAATNIIEKAGYRERDHFTGRIHPFHDEFEKTTPFTSIIELHRNLDNEAILNIPLTTVWNRQQVARSDERNVRVLSPEDCLLHLCLQQVKQTDHFLKYLCDIYRLLVTHETTLDWEYIMESAGTWGCMTGLLHTLDTARRYLAAPLPASALAAIEGKRRRLNFIDFLTGKILLRPPEDIGKMDLETLNIARCLKMDNRRSMFAILKQYRKSIPRAVWLTPFWLSGVLIRAIWNYISASDDCGVFGTR